jgi:hypothetical protein
MKKLIILLSFVALSNAEASYFATHCSNSKAEVKWETGHNSNTLTYLETVIPFYHLDVKFLSETVLKEESIRRCGYASSTKVFAGKVVITASAEYPTALDFLEGENKQIETEVICTTDMNGRAPCP